MEQKPSEVRDRAVRGVIVAGLIFTCGVIVWVTVAFMKAEGIWYW